VKISLLTVIVSLTAATLQARAPNLVIILTDDQGYADVGFNGSQDILTPHIDTIASNGVRFTNGYVTFPVCAPSRAGLLTGRYQGRFGFTTNPTINPLEESAGIPVEEKNIAEILGQVGYTSMIIGKWHLGTHPKHHPLNRGFHEFYGFLSGGHNYFPEELILNDLGEVKEKWGWYHTKIMQNYSRVETDEYLTDEFSNEAVSFVERHQNDSNPFFLYLAYNAPHTPMQAPEKYLKRFPGLEGKRKVYAAMLSAVDDGVGRLLNKIRECDLEESTLIFYLSDNGGATNNGSRNEPLRAHKGSLYEGGIHVPFAAQWKGTLPAGVDYDPAVISLDIPATIAALAAAPISEDRPLDGVNLIPYLTQGNSAPPHSALFWRKYDSMSRAIRQGTRKLVDMDPNSENMELYDLSSDIGERHLLEKRRFQIDISKDAVFEMMSAWHRWSQDLKPLAFPTLGTDVWWNKSAPGSRDARAAPPDPKKVWSIGVLAGSSPFHLESPSDVNNPLITADMVTDIDASVVAHPFITRKSSKFYMFFTAKNKRTDQGEIALAESVDGFKWKYRQIVLDAPYHLAYPYVFWWKGQCYMIPEGVDERSVRLYRATDFPTEWSFERTLIQGEKFISASVVRYENLWWMFVGLQGNQTLRLYYAKELTGTWNEHPQSPIVTADKNIARPGGRPLVIEGSLYRLGQDCAPVYGRAVSAFKVTELDTTMYEEEAVQPPLVEATGSGWSAEGMHHVDACEVGWNRWIAAVDGVQTQD